MTEQDLSEKLSPSLRSYLKSVCLFFGLISIAPALVGFTGAFSTGLGFLLFILFIPASAIALLAGAVLWLVRGVKGSRRAETKRARFIFLLASPTLLIATVVIAWPSLVAGAHMGDLLRLAMNWSHYERIVAKAQSNPVEAHYEEENGITYSVDVGPAVRVAFNPDGFLDNWSGIVFDPTGEVMLADGFDVKTGRFVAPDRITKLFGGDLVGCRRLWRDYYRCSFT